MEKYLPLIIVAVVLAVLSYYNEMRVKKAKEEQAKEEIKNKLKVDLEIEPKEIEEVKKKELDDKK